MLIQKSIHRHLIHFFIVLILFGVGFYFGSTGKAELKGELNATKKESESNKKDIKELRQILSQIAQQPRVNNEIRGVKVKDGSQLHFVPDTELQQLNIDSPVPEQEVKATIPVKDQMKILKLQERLNNLKSEGKRPKRQRKLQDQINRLRNPP